MGKDTWLSICVDIVKKNVIINPIFAPEHTVDECIMQNAKLVRYCETMQLRGFCIFSVLRIWSWLVQLLEMK